MKEKVYRFLIAIKLPEWFGKELSDEVTNSMMATMDIETIKSKLQ